MEAAVQTSGRAQSPEQVAAPAAADPAAAEAAPEGDTTQLNPEEGAEEAPAPPPPKERKDSTGFGTFDEGRAEARLKEAQFEMLVDKEALANPLMHAPDAPRKHYDDRGKPDLANMSEEQRQQVLENIDKQRKAKVEELMKRQKKLDAKKRKEAKKAAAELKAKRDAEAMQKKLFHDREQERERRRLEGEVLQKMRIKALEQAAALDRMQAEQAYFRERRMRIADGRRQNFDRGMALRGGPSAGPSMGPSMGPSPDRGYPFPAVQQSSQMAPSQFAAPPASMGPQRVLHRHVHHHMHYHSGAEGLEKTADSNATQLPAISADVAGAGILPAVDGMRRSGSDPSIGAPVVQKTPPGMVRSASTGYVRPIDGGL